MKALRRIPLLLGLLSALSFLTLCTGIYYVTYFVEGRQQEMIRIALEFGQLAPFPATTKEFNIHTTGSMFTRGFRGSFVDTPEHIQAWLDASPGVKLDSIAEAETLSPYALKRQEKSDKKEGISKQEREELNKSTKIILKPGGGAQYGELIISLDRTRVSFYACWS